MDFRLPPDDDPRRLAVRRWLAAQPDPAPSDLAAAGYVAPGWPGPWGLSADAEHRLVIADELDRAGIDPHGHNPIGIGWAGPTILAAGTADQRARFLWPMLRGEEFWCQLFSEPGSGSDLAGLSTRAIRDGEDWVVTGQKVWNTYAERSHLGMLLARTDPSVPKQRGIGWFVCPMDAPGVTVRTIRQMNEDDGFCEVFLDEVRIPAGHLVGGPTDGWRLAKITLGNERLSLSTGGVLWGRGPRTADLVERMRGVEDPRLRRRTAELYERGEVLRFLGYRMLTRMMAGEQPGPEAAVRKFLADRHGQDVMELAKDALGPEGMVAAGGRWGGDPDDLWHWGYLYARALTIGGGTSQVLRNIIAETILGLPRDADPGHGRPWAERG
jgi:alkylation response protein AidB-like acyl-CoA dehydrogenase